MTLNRDERDIARRWCILNAWGWPDDIPMPPQKAEAREEASRLMWKCVRQIGMVRCLEYWNSSEFDAKAVVRRYSL